MKELILSIFTILACFAFVILFIITGWYIVWKVFLSRFKFVREIMGEASTPESETESSKRPRRSRTRVD